MPEQNQPAPTELRLSPDKRTLTVLFGLARYQLPAEYLRVESPSAEVKGHGPNDARLIAGKREVTIKALETVGNYAVKIVFSDGHSTGIYTWAALAALGQEQPVRWAAYEADLARHGLTRDRPAAPVKRFILMFLFVLSGMAGTVQAVEPVWTPERRDEAAAVDRLRWLDASVPADTRVGQLGKPLIISALMVNPTTNTLVISGVGTTAARQVLLQRVGTDGNGYKLLTSLDKFVLPPQSETLFVTGGNEMQLIDLTGPLQPGMEIPLLLEFSHGTRRTLRVAVGAPTP